MLEYMTTCEPCAHALQCLYEASPCTSLLLIESRTVKTSNKSIPLFRLEEWNTICCGS